MIPFYDMKAVNDPCIEELCAKSAEIIKSGNYVFGTDKFEEEFADYVGTKHCVAVSNGTSALHVALLALGIKEGDEVITVSHTFRATAAAIKYCGATPVFVDINKDTFLMNVGQLHRAITPNTKAIIPVHMYGNVCDMDEILDVANKYNIPVIEDTSQAHGSKYKGKMAGSMGKIGTFSFYPGKGLGALGDAGCIVTNDDYIADYIKSLRTWDNTSLGYNYRMSNLQAEFLRIKLRAYNDILESKKEAASIYDAYFPFCKTRSFVDHSYHVYPILVKDRNTFVNTIKDDVQTKCHYDTPVHKFYSYLSGYDLPITEEVSKTQVSLPMYPGVDAKKVCEIIDDKIGSFL